MRVRTGLGLAAVCAAAFSDSTARADVVLQGQPIQGGLLVGHAEPGSRVTRDGRPIRIGRDGTFLLGLAMDAPETVDVAVQGPDGGVEYRTVRIEQRAYATERIEGLPDDEVHLDAATRVALRRAHRKIERLRRHFVAEAYFSGPFEWPARGRISSPYGVRRVLDGEPRAPHDAVDIAVPLGTTVRAPAAGVVVFAEDDVPLAGRTVLVDHGLGLTSTFLHLSAIRVRPGQRVERGTPLGLSGASGRTTGPHLEWDVHLLGTALDPELIAREPAPSPIGRREPAAPPGQRRGAP